MVLVVGDLGSDDTCDEEERAGEDEDGSTANGEGDGHEDEVADSLQSMLASFDVGHRNGLTMDRVGTVIRLVMSW